MERLPKVYNKNVTEDIDLKERTYTIAWEEPSIDTAETITLSLKKDADIDALDCLKVFVRRFEEEEDLEAVNQRLEHTLWQLRDRRDKRRTTEEEPDPEEDSGPDERSRSAEEIMAAGAILRVFAQALTRRESNSPETVREILKIMTGFIEESVDPRIRRLLGVDGTIRLDTLNDMADIFSALEFLEDSPDASQTSEDGNGPAGTPEDSPARAGSPWSSPSMIYPDNGDQLIDDLLDDDQPHNWFEHSRLFDEMEARERSRLFDSMTTRRFGND
ncbi:hypothetical protein F5Y11DRAFT_320572 [Daldinia sp. FL1419]|nr:hypothetical protein F5Y11DRAFT_320572 [Daldinia sp. FL1419]